MSQTNQIKSFLAVLRANRPLRLLVIAIGVGILAAFLAMQYLKMREAALKEEYLKSDSKMIMVVVAKANLPAGTVLNKSNLAARKVPSMYVHKHAVPPGKFEVVQGRRLLESLGKGRPLLWSHVTGDQRRDFSDVVVAGRRAVTIPVDQLSSIENMIEPGNKVDLYVTLPMNLTGGTGEGDVVFPLLQNVEVLATGRRLNPKVQAAMLASYGQRSRSFNTLTINIKAEEASLLFASSTAGRLSASLRNRNDGDFIFTSVRPNEIIALAQRLSQKVNTKTQVVRDKDGKVIGRVVNGRVVDENGKVIGKVNSDGTVVNSTGEIIGSASPETVLTEKVVRDKNGKIIGKVVNGQVIDEDGNVIGTVKADGSVVSNTGEDMGTVTEKIIDKVEVVRDKNGKIIGRVVNGKVVDADGKVIGKVNEDGSVVSNTGKSLGVVSKEQVTDEIARKFNKANKLSGGTGTGNLLVDYLVGGNSKDGVAVVNKVPIK